MVPAILKIIPKSLGQVNRSSAKSVLNMKVQREDVVEMMVLLVMLVMDSDRL
jgi:hypothetical protein